MIIYSHGKQHTKYMEATTMKYIVCVDWKAGYSSGFDYYPLKSDNTAGKDQIDGEIWPVR